MAKPERVVLLSPMIGVTRFARFAGVAGWPAVFPAFAKAAWLSVRPEFNPFKYNSFPVNGARQTHRLTTALQAQIARLAAAGRPAALPPVLTFQSAVDFTVSTQAIVDALYRSPAGERQRARRCSTSTAHRSSSRCSGRRRRPRWSVCCLHHHAPGAAPS